MEKIGNRTWVVDATTIDRKPEEVVRTIRTSLPFIAEDGSVDWEECILLEVPIEVEL